MEPDAIVVLITVPSPEAGSRIARALVEERLAACVNLVPGLTSTFWWDGGVQSEPEALLMAKTRLPLFEALAARVRALHPYTVPEIIALPLVAGSQAYLDWLQESVTPAGADPPKLT
jgi:periplasmic divalent cation tolerance protein